jgi:hypothetical protein
MKTLLSKLSFILSIIAILALIGVFYCLFFSTLTWLLICVGTYFTCFLLSLGIELHIAPVETS